VVEVVTRVLITGAGGQLGQELVEAFAAPGLGGPNAMAGLRGPNVMAGLRGPNVMDVVACDHATLDVADRDPELAVVSQVRPDAIVHAAAWTDVDGCQLDPDRALRVNALGTRHVVQAARLVGARVCYVSTDYVFDGAAEQPYHEWYTPAPASEYGRSKLGGERELAAAGVAGDTIVRTSWLCGRHGHNFVKTVLTRATAGEPLRVVDDQYGRPTFASDLAGMIRHLVTAHLSGVFHVTNQGATTWYRFACDIVEAAGLDRGLVAPISTAELDPPRPAPRPRYSVLDNAALRLSGIPLLADHHEPLERLVKELVS
jgi:dTDP-4-dehydrorhamnose reductase